MTSEVQDRILTSNFNLITTKPMKNMRTNKLLIPALLATTSLSFGQIVVDGDFEDNSSTTDFNMEVSVNNDNGWNQTAGRGSMETTGGNPDGYFEMSNPTLGNEVGVAQIFTGGSSLENNFVEFDFYLENDPSEAATPNFADNDLRIEVYGTDSTASFGTRFRATHEGTPEPGTGGADWTKLLDETFTTQVQSATAWTTLTTGTISDSTSYDYYAIRFYADTFQSGFSGSELAGIDNVSVVPEPGLAGALIGLVGLGMVFIRRRR
ncbi:MAG: hypothetical protein GVY10_02980 [Verrucomicrobia bacterium]|nr:hypothetical protein [Verrucomicrobiota bacterium]